MTSPESEALALVADLGSKIMKADLAEVDLLCAMVDNERTFEVRGMIYEGIWLTVCDPLYSGDIRPSDLEDE